MKHLAAPLSLGLMACGSEAPDPGLERALARATGDQHPELRLVGQSSSMVCGEAAIRDDHGRRPGFRSFVFLRGSHYLYFEGTPEVASDSAKFADILRSECPNGGGLWQSFSERNGVHR